MADLCVTVNGAGLEDGSDWDNALSAGFTPVRGNTYYIADGDYGTIKTWNTANSGTTPITIKKAIESDHITETGWSSTMGDGLAEWDGWVVSTDYWTFDGQQGGGIGDWNFASGLGFRCYATADGTDCVAIGGSGTRTSLKFYHVNMESDGILGTGEGLAPVRGFDSSTVPLDDLHFSHCAFQRTQNVCTYFNATDNILVERSYFYDNQNNDEYHSEMNTRTVGGSNETWRWNFFHEIDGTAVFAGLATSNQSSIDGLDVYGNIFQGCTTPLYYYFSGGTGYSQIDNAKWYNNTFVDSPQLSVGAFQIEAGASGGNNISRNNLFYRNDANGFVFAFETNSHVWAFDNIRSTAGGIDKDAEIIAAHTDGELGAGDPFVDYDSENPLSSNFEANTSGGYDTGAELPGNDLDMFGNARGSVSSWTRGAIQATISQTMTNPPNTQATQAALDSIKADCDTLNALGVGTSTITASNLTSQDYEAAFATQKTNQDNLNTDNSLGLTLTALPGTFEGNMTALYNNLVAIEAALS